MAGEPGAGIAARIRTDDVAGDLEGTLFCVLDRVRAALLKRAIQPGAPQSVSSRPWITAPAFLVLRGRAAALGSGHELAAESGFFGRCVGAGVTAERLPQLAALSGIALGRGQLLQQVPVFAMVGFQRVINRSHGRRCCDCPGMQHLSWPSVPQIRAA